jgi:hypothetical protein
MPKNSAPRCLTKPCHLRLGCSSFDRGAPPYLPSIHQSHTVVYWFVQDYSKYNPATVLVEAQRGIGDGKAARERVW